MSSDPEHVALCFLDVLGFESQFKSRGLKDTYAVYAKLVEYVVNKQTGGIDIVPVGGFVAVGLLVINQAYFSDSILFWTKYNKVGFASFCSLCADAVCHSIEIGMPVRGAITIGDAILDNKAKIYLGAPLIEGARVETAQQWIGISFGPSVATPPYNEQMVLNGLLPYKSHGKPERTDVITGMVVDWPRKWRETRSSDLVASIRALNTDSRFSQYYDNTLKFIAFSEENHDWFTRQGKLSYG